VLGEEAGTHQILLQLLNTGLDISEGILLKIRFCIVGIDL